MNRFFLPASLLAAALLTTAPAAPAQQGFRGLSGVRGPSGTFSHSPGVAHRSVPSAVPGMAFGGSSLRHSETVPAWRDSGSVHDTHHPDRIPLEVTNSWNRSGRHLWRNHVFVFSGGDWIVDTGGYSLGSSYADTPTELEPAPDDTTADNPPPAPTPAPEAAVAPAQGADDSLPAQVRRSLLRRGYDPGPVTGDLDDKTRTALQTFQQDQGLEATGRISLQTLDALGIR